MQLLTQIIIIAVIFGFFYFILLRPQALKQKERQELIDNLKVGDEVITIGGIIGRVKFLEDESMILWAGDNVDLKMSKGSVMAKHEAAQGLGISQQSEGVSQG